jgi:hypothetical protein
MATTTYVTRLFGGRNGAVSNMTEIDAAEGRDLLSR